MSRVIELAPALERKVEEIASSRGITFEQALNIAIELLEWTSKAFESGCTIVREDPDRHGPSARHELHIDVWKKPSTL